MARAKNDSLTRIVMLLCFGTAFLSLVVHWRITTSTTPQPNLAKTSKTALRAHSQGHPNGITLLSAFAPSKQTTLAASQNRQLVVDLSDRRVYVYSGETVIASYPIGIGKKGWETPTGSFQVLHKQRDPIWQHPITGKIFSSGTDSPLGDRWIGFWTDGRNQIGFHGTPDDEVIGSAISHGCLRMRNPDVRLLYKQVNLGTPVEVRQ
ncbi:L,D-transpeptidase family protein [Scytonema sp. UIC 10036]|uniref:L,D-transpeptidase n=1 Tax=Scytonema sp. UIC 10036 TaxID=2304196 RepID=UPI0012DA1698|nr:L,D-transpeptidase [Scytonema sp. UIC 10036]MUH01637.1 L,D-transpeptidase family protein [Scytonema sp. UIC 10036]